MSNSAPQDTFTSFETPLSKRLVAALTCSLLALQLALGWRSSSDELRVSLLCSAALGFLIWSKRSSLRLEPDVLSQIFGAALISFVLVRLWNTPGSLFASIA